MQDAIFLHQHPSWSPADLDGAPQDIIDLLEAMATEGAKIAQSEQRRDDAKARAAARRSR